MEREKLLSIAQKCEYGAIAFIGGFFIGMGIDYWIEDYLVYNVPRILIPIFNLCGSTGLALGLCIIGVGLVGYGFSKWKKIANRQFIYGIIIILGIVSSALNHISFKSSDDIMNEINQHRDEQIEAIRKSDKPNFKNQDLEKHLAHFDALYKRFEQALESKNDVDIAECQELYGEWLTKIGEFVSALDNDEKYALSQYNAKLATLWSDLMQKYLTE